MHNPTPNNVTGLLFVHIPKVGGATRSVSIDDDESVVKKLMPKDLRKKISKASNEGQKAIKEHLVKFNRGIYFVAPPLKERLPVLKEAIASWQNAYGAIRDEIDYRWTSDIEPRIVDFQAKYSKSTNTISKEEVLQRYSPEVTWMPFNPEGLKDVLKDEAEVDRMKAKFEQQATQAIKDRVKAKMDELTTALNNAIAQASTAAGKARKINKKTILKIEKGAQELAAILQAKNLTHDFSEIKSLNDTIDEIKKAGTNANSSSRKNKDNILGEMLKAAKAAKDAANPLIQRALEDNHEEEKGKEVPTPTPSNDLDAAINMF